MRAQSLERHRRLHLPRRRRRPPTAARMLPSPAPRSAQRRSRGCAELARADVPAARDRRRRAARAAVLAGEPRPRRSASTTRAGWCRRRCTAMLQPLETLRQPTGALYRLHTAARPAIARARPTSARLAPTAIVLDGARVDVGFSIDLTIDPALQALAQKTAACYTGRHDVCRALGMQRAEDKEQPLGQPLLEGAMVRMAAVAVIDVASGRIEALAGALSPCARQEVDGPGPRRGLRPAPAVPGAVPARMRCSTRPCSTTRCRRRRSSRSWPRRSSSDPRGRRRAGSRPSRRRCARGAPPARDSLRGQLMRSDSARFLDRMFCSDKGFAALPAGRGTCRRRRRRSAGTPAAPRRGATAASATCCSAAPLDAGDGRGAVGAAGDAGRLRPPDERAARPAGSARRCT